MQKFSGQWNSTSSDDGAHKLANITDKHRKLTSIDETMSVVSVSFFPFTLNIICCPASRPGYVPKSQVATCCIGKISNYFIIQASIRPVSRLMAITSHLHDGRCDVGRCFEC